MTSPPLPASGYAVVTGAASGIGREVAKQLADDGWRVARLDCQPQDPSDDLALRCDVSQPDDWRRVEEQLRAAWPRVDLVVNCAGVLTGGNLLDCPIETLTRVVDVNVRGTLLGCRVLGAWLAEGADDRPRGLKPRAGFVNISSIFAALAPPGFAAYNASKAAVLSLSESLRAELTPLGLNVTAVVPGVVRTPLFQRGWFATDAYRAASERFYQTAQLEPTQVAQAAIAAAARGQGVTVVGGRARRLWLLKRLFPSSVRRYVERRAARELQAAPAGHADPPPAHAG